MEPLGPGDEIGGYLIEGLAGRGGMGLVYRARQRRPERVVAIKVIAPELAADASFRARFEQESSIAAQIEHPNVIPVYAVDEDGGLLFIAMRFVQGTDLGAILAEHGALPPERATRLIAQAADALDAAHSRGLIHRDVKPGNILVDIGDHVYLTDFGLTKRSADTSGITKTGMFVGTVDYIAPEQVEGRRLDARADVYALGCVLYQTLSGGVPFPRDSDIAKIFAHVNDEPAPLTGVPAELAAAVSRAMAKRPEDRYVSAGDFGRAAVAGAGGRFDPGSGHTVARGAAAASDQLTPRIPTRQSDAPRSAESDRTEIGPSPAHDPTRLAGSAPPPPVAPIAPGMGPTPRVADAGPTRQRAPAATGPTQERPPGQTGPSGPTPPGGPKRKRRISPTWLAAGAGVLLAAIVAGGFAIASGGSSTSTSSSSSTGTTPSTSTSSSSSTSTSTSTTPAPAPTQARIFSVVSPDGSLTLTGPQAQGSCFAGSEAINRNDAWRCSVGNNLYDPCFEASSSSVVCPTDGPWGTSGVIVQVSGGLDSASADPGPVDKSLPWAIQMANGAHCEIATGASNEIAGQRLNYFCTGGLGLYGTVDRSGSVWTIYAAGRNATQITMQPIAIVWY